MRPPLLIIVALSAFLLRSAAETRCVRRPSQTHASQTPGNNGFQVEIRPYNVRNEIRGSVADVKNSSTPEGYIPGEFYIITIRGWQTRYTVQTFRGFSLVAQTAAGGDSVGVFDVSQNAQARASPNCPQGVSESSLHPKTSIDVMWRAPDNNVGCIEFKAMVMEYRDIWYMDEGPLTQRFCQIIGYEKLLPDDQAQKCCACDEAKYELEFDGLWSRQTHPKDFPTLEHLTHFTDVIGASHSNAFSMWALGNYATDGLKELAEWGNTYKAEQELKEHAKEIRTIIKAKGLWYPEVQGKTKASFRMDKYHHLVSLASMFGPSPDWCVGISAINLCLPDCSWIGERTFDLYPWDAGTDNGATYMAPNNPAQPREKIKDITTKTDPRSPFYDAHSDEMRPMARLTIRRSAVYPMECKSDAEYQQAALNASSGTSEDEEYKDRRECMTGSWTPWSLCSATCGKGIRMRSRVYKFAVKAQMFNCQRQMTEKQFCNAHISVCEDSEAFNEKCAVTSWADWTDCSVTCEAGIRSRTRNFINPTEAAGSGCNVDLVAQEQCTGAGGNDCSVTPDPLCRTTFWSEWSPCSASCGDGMRVRTRLFFYPENEHRCTATSLMETEPCSVETCRRFFVRHSVEICQEEKEPGQCGGTFPRYWYNAATKTCERFVYTGCKGNRNQFESEEQCKTACMEGFDREEDEEVGTEAVEFSITPAALTNTHLVPTNTHLTSTNPQPSPTNLHPTPTNPRVSTPSYARMNTTTVEISNSVAPPEVELHATVYRNMGTKDRPHLTMMTTKNAEMNDNRLREDVQTRPMADGSAHLPSKKVLKSMATLLGVPNLDHLIDFSSGKICVPANHLANVLGLDDGSINDGGAPVGCMVTEWSPWSNCSKSCGTGKRQRTRSIKVLPRNGGELCPEKMVQKRRCQQRPCPVKSCRVTQWTSWSPCTTSCGAGMQLRQRRVIQPRGEYRFLSDGDMCDWKTVEKRECNTPCFRYFH